MELEVGTLVMWNSPLHEEHGDCGIVVETTPQYVRPDTQFSFLVAWCNGGSGRFGESLLKNKIKILNF